MYKRQTKSAPKATPEGAKTITEEVQQEPEMEETADIRGLDAPPSFELEDDEGTKEDKREVHAASSKDSEGSRDPDGQKAEKLEVDEKMPTAKASDAKAVAVEAEPEKEQPKGSDAPVDAVNTDQKKEDEDEVPDHQPSESVDAYPTATATGTVDSDRPAGEAEITTRWTELSEVTAPEKPCAKSVQFAEETIVANQSSQDDGIVVAVDNKASKGFFTCGSPMCGSMNDIDASEKDNFNFSEKETESAEKKTDEDAPLDVEEDAQDVMKDDAPADAPADALVDAPADSITLAKKRVEPAVVSPKSGEDAVAQTYNHAATDAVLNKMNPVTSPKSGEVAVAQTYNHAATDDVLNKMKTAADLQIQKSDSNYEGFGCVAVFNCGFGKPKEEPAVIKMSLSEDLIMEARETTEKEVEDRQKSGDLAKLEGDPDTVLPPVENPPVDSETEDKVAQQSVEDVTSGAKPVEEKVTNEKPAEDNACGEEPEKCSKEATDEKQAKEDETPEEKPKGAEASEESSKQTDDDGGQVKKDQAPAEEKIQETEPSVQNPEDETVQAEKSATSVEAAPENKTIDPPAQSERQQQDVSVVQEEKKESTEDSTSPVPHPSTEPADQKSPDADATPSKSPAKEVIEDKAQDQAYACCFPTFPLFN